MQTIGPDQIEIVGPILNCSLVAEQGGGGVGRLRRHLYMGSSFARKCISTTQIGAPIYIWPPAAIPPASLLFLPG